MKQHITLKKVLTFWATILVIGMVVGLPLFYIQDAPAQEEDTRPGATFVFDPVEPSTPVQVEEVKTDEETKEGPIIAEPENSSYNLIHLVTIILIGATSGILTITIGAKILQSQERKS